MSVIEQPSNAFDGKSQPREDGASHLPDLSFSYLSIQKLIDEAVEGAVVDLPKGDFGPVKLWKPIVLNANDSTFWARGTEPAVGIMAGGVCLQNATLRAASNEDSLVVFEITPATHPGLQSIRVHGRVDGIDAEEDKWVLPRRLDIGEIRAPIALFGMHLGVSGRARLSSRISGIEFDPRELHAGFNEVTIVVRDLSQDSILIGDLELLAAELTRLIPLYARVLRFAPDVAVAPKRTLFTIPNDLRNAELGRKKTGSLLPLPEWFKSQMLAMSSARVVRQQSCETPPDNSSNLCEDLFDGQSPELVRPSTIASKPGPVVGAVNLTPFVLRQRVRLLQLRDFALDSITGVAKDNLRTRAESNAYGMHQADAGSDAYEFDLALSLLSHEQDVLFEIDKALNRIDAGAYGVCEMSGKPINFARLEALPFARYTVEFQSQMEKYGKVSPVRVPTASLFGLTLGDEYEKRESEEPEEENQAVVPYLRVVRLD